MRFPSKALLIGMVSLMITPAALAEVPGYAAGNAAGELVHQMDLFLRSYKTKDGITPDLRYTRYPTEQIRLSIVPQLLGYHRLYLTTGNKGYLKEMEDRAEYLTHHMKDAIRQAAYDGMLGYSFLVAYQDTNNPEFKKAGDKVVDEMMGATINELYNYKYQYGLYAGLNVGLMGAMALAKSYELNPKPEILARLNQMLDLLERHQNSDGSFPHAWGGEDTHYTGWMGMELILIRDCVGAERLPQIDRMLERLGPFLRDRINMQPGNGAKIGEPTYASQVCTTGGRCETVYHYAKATARYAEYDTLGWSNELGYEVFVLRALGDSEHADAVTQFATSLIHDGAFPDKWAYPMDPVLEPDQYPISRDPQSVIRTSLLFWELAATL